LKIFPSAKPIKQKLCRFSNDKKEAIRLEVARLQSAGFIREVYHPEWLANPVLALKKNNKEWRMIVGEECGEVLNSSVQVWVLLRCQRSNPLVESSRTVAGVVLARSSHQIITVMIA